MIIKEILRTTLIFLHLDITKNLEYDRLTKMIMKNNLAIDSNCIDIGCHKGEILDLMFKYSPKGNHYAFEPIPYLYSELAKKYQNKAKVFPYALSDKNGKTSFQLVKNAPAYSGIKKRRYDIPNPEIEEIKVELKTLDSIVPLNEKVDFIKIDVEGGEFGVLRGAENVIKKNKPIIIFECGKGASDYYGTTPLNIFNYITQELELKIFTLKSYMENEKPLSLVDFENYFNSNKEYYFVAGT